MKTHLKNSICKWTFCVNLAINFPCMVLAQEAKVSDSLLVLNTKINEFSRARIDVKKEYFRILEDALLPAQNFWSGKADNTNYKSQWKDFNILSIRCIENQIFQKEDAPELVKYVLCFDSVKRDSFGFTYGTVCYVLLSLGDAGADASIAELKKMDSSSDKIYDLAKMGMLCEVIRYNKNLIEKAIRELGNEHRAIKEGWIKK